MKNTEKVLYYCERKWQTREKRAEYIRSLAEAQDSDDSHPFVEFMMNHHIENILEQIKEYKESMER